MSAQNLSVFHVERTRRPVIEPAIGQWYWVKGDREDYACSSHPAIGFPGDEYGWFGCIVLVGSNMVELHSPSSGRDGYSTTRVLFEDMDDQLLYEPDHQGVIARSLSHYQEEVNRQIAEVKRITSRLGVVGNAIEEHQPSDGAALMVLSSENDPDRYKNQLIKARDEDLPTLFDDIKQSNAAVAKWMSAETTGLLAEASQLDGTIGRIEQRIFNVELYAGLTENVALVREGDTAGYADKIHLMQRMMFMDEECLLDYEAGGMDIESINQFDAWLSREANLDRCLPFPKTVVLFRVRRNIKGRTADLNPFIKVALEQEDKLTFMYIRNGGNLYRLNCAFEFGEKMFPDEGSLDLGEPMMAKMFCSSVDKLMPRREWEDRLAEAKGKVLEEKRLSDQWIAENPEEKWLEKWRREHPGKEPGKGAWIRSNPYRSWLNGEQPTSRKLSELEDYEPFDQGNLFYDEIMARLRDEMGRFNRVALILQGLLDRSPVLHPHPKARTWEAAGFELAFELIYDGSNVLYHGDAPDFEAYRQSVNAVADEDSVFYGQQDYWEQLEAEKECRRRDNDWRDEGKYRPVRWKPYGNPGPGRIAKPSKFLKKSQKVRFSWERMRLKRPRWIGDPDGPIATHVTVPLDELFNVSGYQPGDYKRFFQDPRTRQEYLKWAPFLLSAEDYHSGVLKSDQED